MLVPSSSDSTRAAPLDGALSFSILLQEQRDITLSSAKSGVTGLLSAIQSAPQDYTTLLEISAEVLNLQNDAASRLSNPAWITTPDATALIAALDAALTAALADVTTATNGTLTAATAAKNGTTDPSTERDLATQAETAATALTNALAQIVAGDDATAADTVATARADATTARDNAIALLADLNSQNPVPADRVVATQAVLNAALAVLDRAHEIDAALATAAVAAAGETPVSYQLTNDTANPTLLTVWGESGTLSLTDASGAGVLVSADGRVDSIPASGLGWQFQTDATFVLPDGTKVSITPGNPASVLATRGQQQLEVANLGPGLVATTNLSNKGGVKADAAHNDGYLFNMGATPADWTLAGAILGDDPGAREVVATTPLANEVTIDVSNVDLPSDLAAKLASIGIDPAVYDANQDGKYNNRELQALSSAVEKLVEGATNRFDSALSRTAAAVAPMQRLNQFLARLIAASDRRQANHGQAVAEEREQLRQIQRDIEEAHYALRQAPAERPTPAPANVVVAARVVLNQIETFGAPKDVPPEAPRTPSSLPRENSRLPGAENLPATGSDPALRRAERLLSGFAGGAPLRPFLPPARPLQPGLPTPPPTETKLPALLSDLLAAPSELPAPRDNLTAILETSAPSLLSIAAETPKPKSPLAVPNQPPSSASTPEPRERRPEPSPAQIPPAARPATPPPTSTARPSVPLSEPQFAEPVFPARDPLATPRVADPRPSPAEMPARPEFPRPPENGRPEPAPEPRPAATLPAPVQPVSARVLPREPDSVRDAIRLPARPAPQPPTAPSGLPDLPGTGYPATGPDPLADTDPTSGSDLGPLRANRIRLDQHLAVHREHVARKQAVQTQVRQTIEQFVSLVARDEELRQVFQTDDLSDEQAQTFRSKVESIERDLGVNWGGPAEKTPQGETNLQARMLKSGLMI